MKLGKEDWVVSKHPLDDFKILLKQITPVHEVIQALTGTVQQAGNNYVACCPFHQDDKPSLMIKPDTNTWSCLGCGAGSKMHSRATSADVFGFVRGFYNCSFPQAVEWVAKFTNTPIPVLDPQQQYKANQHMWWVQKCNQTHQRFQQNLMQNRDAYKYLRNRAVDDTDIVLWGLGFGDGEEQDFMNTKGKISFAIHDYNGDIISFTGRVPFGESALATLNEQEKAQSKRETPKFDHRWPLNEKFVTADYIKNHPYPEFERSHYLYGISQAKSYIAQWKTAILVEGFNDVISMHKHGLRHTVATLGTSLSETHVLMLKRAGAKKVILMRDGDKAGLLAMERDAPILMKHGIIVEVCPLPDGHDPDSLCRTFSPLDDSLSKYLLRRTRTLTQWRVEKVFKEQQDEVLYHYSRIGEIQTSRMDKVIAMIAAEQDVIQQDILMRQYSDLFSISYESLRQSVMSLSMKGAVS